jgi:small-conductance mechanosensitive channel
MIRSLVMLRAGLVALVVALVLWAGASAAQELPGVDMGRWQSLVEQVEALADDADTQNTTLEALRSEVVAFREQFSNARLANAARIASLREQIELLGPAPADDAAPEAAEIAATRAELEAQLAVLAAPVQMAESVFIRADGLVSEIDTILRSRQAEALLQVSPTPLNPVNWQAAYAALSDAISKLWVAPGPEAAAVRQVELRQNLPIILFSSLTGLILILRGRRWSTMIVGKLRDVGARGLGIWSFVVSLLRIFFPLLGLALISYAARMTGYLGERGDELVLLIPVLGAAMLGFRWVAEQIFAREDEEALLELNASDRKRGRFLVSGMTVLLIAHILLVTIIELDSGSIMTKTTVTFPITLLLGYGLYRIGRLLRRIGGETVASEEGEVTRASTLGRLVRFLGTVAIVVAVAAPLLQAAGYYNAREALMRPTILTLVILGLVLALQRFAADVYGALSAQGKQAREALLPIFFGLVLLLLAMPVLALVWGARVADLTEIWAAFRRGFAIGESRISPTDFLTFAVIFAVGYFATRLAQGALKTNVLPKTKIDKGGQNAIVSGLGYVGIFLAGLLAITGAGIDLSSLAIVAGALSVGIGFGLQNIVSNFVSGIILLIERPISEGDWIEVSGGQMGHVRDISVRSTRIETFDRTDVIVPNADLVSGTVINYTRGNTLGRVIIPIGVAYGTDTRRVETILYEIANEHPMALANPAPMILFISFGASSLDFEVRMFLRDVNWTMVVKNDVNHAIAKRFAEEGIEIPFPQQDLWLRNPEALQNPPVAKVAARQTAAGDAPEQSDAAKGEGDR